MHPVSSHRRISYTPTPKQTQMFFPDSPKNKQYKEEFATTEKLKEQMDKKQVSTLQPRSYSNIRVYCVNQESSKERLKQKIQESQQRKTLFKINLSSIV